MTYNDCWQTCPIKGQIVNSVVFVGPMVSVAMAHLCHVAPKPLQICEQKGMAASNKTLFIETGSRPASTSRLRFADPSSSRELSDVDPAPSPAAGLLLTHPPPLRLLLERPACSCLKHFCSLGPLWAWDPLHGVICVSGSNGQVSTCLHVSGGLPRHPTALHCLCDPSTLPITSWGLSIPGESRLQQCLLIFCSKVSLLHGAWQAGRCSGTTSCSGVSGACPPDPFGEEFLKDREVQVVTSAVRQTYKTPNSLPLSPSLIH